MKLQLSVLLSLLILTQTSSAQSFTESSAFPAFQGFSVATGSIAFVDIDNDNDLDVLISGRNNSSTNIAQIHTNNGSGSFTEPTENSLEGVLYSSAAFADIDGDDDQDLLITGRDNSDIIIAKLYTNDGSGVFTEIADTPFEGVMHSSVAFADIDGDNDQDLLISGRNSAEDPTCKLYTNNGSGVFTLDMSTPFPGVDMSSIAFADIDGDNDQDVLITGQSGSSPISKLYTNDGTGEFTLVSPSPFDQVRRSSIAFADVDGDDDLDVVITGVDASWNNIAKVYMNDSNGGFTELEGNSLEGVYNSSVAFGDVDNDSDLDLLLTGQMFDGPFISRLYTNDGNGVFSEVQNTPFEGVEQGSVAIADVDNDQDQDIFITGRHNVGYFITKLYTNDLFVSIAENSNEDPELILKLFPNPTTSGRLSLEYSARQATNIVLNIYDMKGSLQKTQQETLFRGEQLLNLDIRKLGSGKYLLELIDGDLRKMARFTVQ